MILQIRQVVILALLLMLGLEMLSPPAATAQRTPIRRAQARLTITGEDQEYFFDRVSSLVVTPDSNVLVLLPGQSSILRFNNKGAYLGRWGRAGSGPGEMRRASRLGVTLDTVWVFDLALARISLFSVAGQFYRSIRVPIPGTAFLLQDHTIAALPSMTYSVGREKGPPILVRKYSHGGVLLDTMVQIPPTYRVLQYERGGGTVVGMQPFEDGPLVIGASDGSGFVVINRSVNLSRFRSVRISASGDTLFDSQQSYAPLRMTPSMVDKAVADLVSQGPPTNDPQLAPRIRNALFKPRVVPTITNALIGQDSTIWLRREMTWEENIRWTVLDSSGKVLFDVSLPTLFVPQVATRSVVWGVIPGEDDVPVIRRYEISS